jgi:dihydroneopterin aldolase
MDIIYIRNLKIETVIGVFDWERRIRQTVNLDLEMAADIRKAAVSDNIHDALDYLAVSQRLTAFVSASEFLLVETLAEKIAEIVQQEFQVPWLRLRLSKPGALRNAQEVGVIMERGKMERGKMEVEPY